MADPTESIDDPLKTLEKAEAILLIKEDVLPSVTTACHMIDCTLKLESKWPRHEVRVAQRYARDKV